MRNLYPNYFQITVVAYSKQYIILLPIYKDKDAFRPVAKDEMLFPNHDFYRLAKLVCADF